MTIPPTEVQANRGANGTVIIRWQDDPRNTLILMYHGAQIQYRLVYNARMEMEEKYQILGVANEFNKVKLNKMKFNEVIINTLPNDQILEVCLQIRHKTSKIRDWSNCSKKATLRTRFIENLVTPTEIPKSTKPPILYDRAKERQIILISVVVLLSSFLTVAYFIKSNWLKIR